MVLTINVDGRKQVFDPPIKPETLRDLKKLVSNAFPEAACIFYRPSIDRFNVLVTEKVEDIEPQEGKDCPF